MSNMANMASMNAMGGPVGGPMAMANNNGVLPPQAGGGPRQLQLDSSRTLLNTYIYEYFMRYKMYDAARAVWNNDPNINVKKEDERRDRNGSLIGNGLGDDPMDTDSKDGLDQKPDDLPNPNVPTPVPDSCFLYEWFCLFWDVFNSQKGKGSSLQVNQYVSHTQVCSVHGWKLSLSVCIANTVSFAATISPAPGTAAEHVAQHPPSRGGGCLLTTAIFSAYDEGHGEWRHEHEAGEPAPACRHGE